MKKLLRHDFYFKSLLGKFFPEFIELFFPEMLTYLDVSSITAMDKEILGDVGGEQSNEVDLVMKAKFKNRDSFFVVHVEVQAQAQTDFPERLFKYFAKLYAKYEMPVYPIVVFAFEKPLKVQPSSYEIRFSDVQVVKFNYRCVQLNQLNWRDYVNVLNPIAAALMGKMRVAREERALVKLGSLALLKKLDRGKEEKRLLSGFIDVYLRLTASEMEEYKRYRNELDPEIREAVMDFETSWKIEGREEGIELGLQQGLEQGQKQGLQQGLEQGQKQGLQLGMAMLLEKQLNLRFGALSQESIARMRELDPEKLLQLNEALLGFKTTADLERWFANNIN